VVVIGTRVRDLLFAPDEDPVGQRLEIKGISFTVVGTFTSSRLGNSAQRESELILMPNSTFREELHEYSEKLEEKVRRRTKSLEKEVKLKEDAEQALKNSQRLYEEIAMNFPNGTITVLDQNFCIVFIEGTELRDSGYQTSKLLGQNYLELLPEEVRAECIHYFEAALKGKHSVFEIEHDQKVYLARSVPLNPEGEQIMQILHVEINISAQKKAEEEIYKALRKEKELNELKSKFVSLASHEFRTPLSSILSSAALIGKYELEADQHKRQRHIQKIRTNVQNMNIILNDFLSLEKIETGLIKNKAQQLNIKELIEEIVEETSTLKKAGQMLSTHFHHKQNLWKLDPFLLRNILNNLLSNAFKYSSESSEVQLITHEDPNLRIEVIDGGIGISEEDQKQLFNRFFRAENALNTEGTGLGLSIVKRYAELMNAEISFESELNKGSSFKIKFT
jgi:PAS domain S-box-containing protein